MDPKSSRWALSSSERTEKAPACKHSYAPSCYVALLLCRTPALDVAVHRKWQFPLRCKGSRNARCDARVELQLEELLHWSLWTSVAPSLAEITAVSDEWANAKN